MTDLKERWREEKESAWLYRIVAKVEPDRRKSELFSSLAKAADEQACIVLSHLGGPEPRFRPSLRAHLVAWLTAKLTPERCRPLLAAMKVRGLSVYRAEHERGHSMPTIESEIGRRHRIKGANGTLRAAVFGINDGLVSNTCLILGVSGASPQPKLVLLSGIAGLLAGAFSMAAGEYVSMRSQRELYEYQIGQERDELHRYPREEAEELALVYHARGVPLDEARQVALRMLSNPEQALNTLAREELGLNPDDLGSPWGAAVSSFGAFAVGALVPLVPFLVGAKDGALWITCVLVLITLFAVGAALSLFSGKNAWHGGLRMLVIGSLAASATYAIGRVLGVSLS